MTGNVVSSPHTTRLTSSCCMRAAVAAEARSLSLSLCAPSPLVPLLVVASVVAVVALSTMPSGENSCMIGASARTSTSTLCSYKASIRVINRRSCDTT
jgi:hypothetical protein